MSNLGLFAIGTLVTLIVAAAMALLIWGAVQDGRDQREYERAESDTAQRRLGETLHVVDAA
jgi:hypothetical protein